VSTPSAEFAGPPDAGQSSAIQPTAKLFASRCDTDPRHFIEVFHSWIQRGALEGVLIDVADYTHVQDGPGVLLVAHEAYWGMDRSDGRMGMMYRRRRGEPEEAGAALTLALRAAAGAAKLLEAEDAGVEFATTEALVGFDDRLAAPNTAETFEAMKPLLEGLAKRLFGDGASVEPVGEPREPFRARLRSAGPGPGLDGLLERLA
jgi:hypothetical protein